MTNNIPAIGMFDELIGPARKNPGAHWDNWIQRLENYLLAINVTNDLRKRANLLHFIGPLSYEDFLTLPNRGVTYDDAKTALRNFFRPQVNVEFEVANFRSLRQKSDENVDSYYVRLRQAATNCAFHDIDAEIKSHLIQTMKDRKVRKKGLSRQGAQLTLQDVLADARNNELVNAQNEQIERQFMQMSVKPTVNKLQKRPQRWKKPRTSGNTCYNCGGSYPHQGGQRQCPAYGSVCGSCKKVIISQHIANRAQVDRQVHPLLQDPRQETQIAKTRVVKANRTNL